MEEATIRDFLIVRMEGKREVKLNRAVDFYSLIDGNAANLLYSAIKNHSFVDGNKHMTAAFFVLILEGNHLLKSK